mmetsp:Transcript_68454/g.216544  ORF Transcript_68454/g.216544 Transcript_68454/m.216544 type:complete len:338 (-) Transcript_68454:48-1061(-)
MSWLHTGSLLPKGDPEGRTATIASSDACGIRGGRASNRCAPWGAGQMHLILLGRGGMPRGWTSAIGRLRREVPREPPVGLLGQPLDRGALKVDDLGLHPVRAHGPGELAVGVQLRAVPRGQDQGRRADRLGDPGLDRADPDLQAAQAGRVAPDARLNQRLVTAELGGRPGPAGEAHRAHTAHTCSFQETEHEVELFALPGPLKALQPQPPPRRLVEPGGGRVGCDPPAAAEVWCHHKVAYRSELVAGSAHEATAGAAPDVVRQDQHPSSRRGAAAGDVAVQLADPRRAPGVHLPGQRLRRLPVAARASGPVAGVAWQAADGLPDGRARASRGARHLA